jgi:hypothetical protein
MDFLIQKVNLEDLIEILTQIHWAEALGLTEKG